MQFKIAVILYKSKKLKNGKHPIMVRITKDKERKHLALGIDCAADKWDSIRQVPKPNHPQCRVLTKLIDKVIRNYYQILLENYDSHLTLEQFSALVKDYTTDCPVFDFFDVVINELQRSGKKKNAAHYKTAKSTLQQFSKRKNLSFLKVDINFLNRYEKYLRRKGLAVATIFAYLKIVRSLFNKAIQKGIINKKHYPFKDFNMAKFPHSMPVRKSKVTPEMIAQANQCLL